MTSLRNVFFLSVLLSLQLVFSGWGYSAGKQPSTRPAAPHPKPAKAAKPPKAIKDKPLNSLQDQLRQFAKSTKKKKSPSTKAAPKKNNHDEVKGKTLDLAKRALPTIQRPGLKDELERLRKRRALLKKMKKLWARKPVQKRTTKVLLKDLGSYDWFEQNRVVRELVRRCPKTKAILQNTLRNSPNLRIRLLATVAYKRCGGKSVKPLLDILERYHDIPLPLTLGVLLEQGEAAVLQPLLARLKNTRTPRQLLRALTFFPNAQTAPVYERFLQHKNESLRSLAQEAVLRLPPKAALQLLANKLAKTKKIQARAALIRSLSRLDIPQTIPVFANSLKDSNSSVRFLTKLTLKDRVAAYQKRLGKKQIAKAPNAETTAPWIAWWNQHKAALLSYEKKRPRTTLTALKASEFKKTSLLYTTIHPMFGFGRMPALIYDASQPKPTLPYKGRLWYFPMKSKKFAALLQKVVGSGFFQWKTHTGSVRDLTLIHGGRSRRVRIGDARHLRFEAIEEVLTTWLRSKRFRLLFKDFFLRPDDYVLTREGKIGQWAYRDSDRLPTIKWGKWAPASDLETAFTSLQELHQKLPSRVRLMSLDIAKHRIRLSMLMFGSRFLGRMTRETLAKSRRFPGKPKFVGTAVRYLSRDKIEQYIFDVQCRRLPARPVSKKRQKIDVSQALLEAISTSGGRTTELHLKTTHHGTTRIRLHIRLAGTPALLRLLSALALRSSGDRVINLRINHSGEHDRVAYPLVLQLALEMGQTYKAPSKTPFYLQLSTLRPHEMFQLVYK